MIWTRKKFMDTFGEDPVDILGNDWRNHIDEYEPLGNNAEPIRKLPEDDWRKDDR